MHALDDAHRTGLISDDDAYLIADVVRRGHVYGARKRLAAAKKRGQGVT